MINKIGQIMIYCTDQNGTKDFFLNQLGFQLVEEFEPAPGMKTIEIKANAASETSFVLHDKAIIEKMNMGVNLGTPSVMFFASDLDALYEKLKSAGVTVGDMVTMPTGRVFNFATPEGQYFAVCDKQ